MGEPLCAVFQKISGIEKIYGEEGEGGECHHFRSIFFCLTVSKNFVGQPFRVSLFSGIENFHASEGFVTNICRIFLSHSAEKFRRGTLPCFVAEVFL